MGKSKENLLILLQEAQNKSGYLSQELMVELAKSLNVSLSDVYGVATFYSFLSAKPQARNVIRICKSVPCYLKNSQMIIETVGNKIGIKPGETTPDDKFSFQLTNCIGACDKAPAMMINHEVYGDLNPNKIAKILKSYL
ncbi:MAG TPA: NADH-quinone oxidoreductase subunit NuoE [Dehalococcoidia bacterium]|jgi:NADH-quinone oxidoreductase E subunit|nr:NADH-quinone oxidoreductase subunit NuoE [Dehalococcoidia bacterium]